VAVPEAEELRTDVGAVDGTDQVGEVTRVALRELLGGRLEAGVVPGQRLPGGEPAR
jgi:hypothetical protein